MYVYIQGRGAAAATQCCSALAYIYNASLCTAGVNDLDGQHEEHPAYKTKKWTLPPHT